MLGSNRETYTNISTKRKNSLVTVAFPLLIALGGQKAVAQGTNNDPIIQYNQTEELEKNEENMYQNIAQQRQELVSDIFFTSNKLSISFFKEKLFQQVEEQGTLSMTFKDEFIDNLEYIVECKKHDMLDNVVVINYRIPKHNHVLEEVVFIAEEGGNTVLDRTVLRYASPTTLKHIYDFLNTFIENNQEKYTEANFTIDQNFTGVGYKIPENELPAENCNNKEFFNYLVNMYENNNRKHPNIGDISFVEFFPETEQEVMKKMLRNLETNKKASDSTNIYNKYIKICEKTGKVASQFMNITKTPENDYHIELQKKVVEDIGVSVKYAIKITKSGMILLEGSSISEVREEMEQMIKNGVSYPYKTIID